MKTLSLVLSILLSATSVAAVAQTTQTPAPSRPPTSTAPATHPALPSVPATKATDAPTSMAEHAALKKQIGDNEKTALAECKKLSGAARTHCMKQAHDQQKAASDALKAK